MNRRHGRAVSRLLYGGLLTLATVSPHAAAFGQQISAEEASGIVRHGDDLLIASDNVAGAYFRFRLPSPTPSVLTITPDRLEKIEFRGGTLGMDLEGITVLADGRVAVVSERLRVLLGDGGVIAEYDDPLSEIGNRGLSGVAARDKGNGVSEVAVVWEGGYPARHDLPEDLRNALGSIAMSPVIWVHDLHPGAMNLRIRQHQARKIRLKPPLPAGDEPLAQRFRAVDLVWHVSKDGVHGSDRLGFIVLLVSNNSPHQGPSTFEHVWLQRFGMNGEPVGQPIDVKTSVPTAIREAKWDGLGWFHPGKSVVIVHDVPPRGDPTAVIITLPSNW